MASKRQRRIELTINSLRASFYQLDLPKQKALIEALKKEPLVRKNTAYQLFLEECIAYYAQGVFFKQEQDRIRQREAAAARLRAIESLELLRTTKNKRRVNRTRRNTQRPVIIPPKELGNCAACGRERIPDMIFCIFCAHKYENNNTCENCGVEKIPGNKFCINCGNKLE